MPFYLKQLPIVPILGHPHFSNLGEISFRQSAKVISHECKIAESFSVLPVHEQNRADAVFYSSCWVTRH